MLIPFSMGSCSSKKNRDAVKLVHAIQENNIDEVRRLLEEGIDPNVPTFPESKFNAFKAATSSFCISFIWQIMFYKETTIS